MEIIFKKCKLDYVKEEISCNLNSHSSPIDSFYEDFLLNSTYYVIQKDDLEIGYFALNQQILLTGFWIMEEYRMFAGEIFEEMKIQFSFKQALVPTADEFLLSYAMDNYTKIEKQALLFQDSHNNLAMVRPDVILTPAGPDDIDIINQSTENFFDNPEKSIKNKNIFLAKSHEDLVGFGIIEESKLLHKHASVGLYTIPKYRSQGIGVSILLLLKEICYQRGLKPIAGCWYYNDSSRRTLHKAGFYSNTRLLNIYYISIEE